MITYLRFEGILRYAGPLILLALAFLSGFASVALAVTPQDGEPSTANWALQFDGVNDYVDLNPSPLGQLASLTVEAWVRIDEGGKLHYLVTNAYDDFNDGFSLVVGVDGRVTFVVAFSVATRGIAVSSTGLPVGEWHHVAGVYDGANNAVKVYVDGVEEAVTAYTGGIRYSGARDLLFGSQKKGFFRTSRYLKGALDEIRIWGTARAADDIAANMGAEIDEGSSGLLGYWRFNEGSGLSAEDMTSASNTGKLVQGPEWIEAGWQVVAPVQVAIDIRPFSRRNLIVMNRGRIPVAVLSTEDFNAGSDVDPSSLTFGRTGFEQSLHLRGNNRPACRVWDVNRDRRSDLVCWFVAQATEFEAGDTHGVLRGMTTSGAAIVGSDAIIVKGLGRKRFREGHVGREGER